MNKIPGATLGTVEKVLKKLYTERVRRILEYGYWSTAAKSNFKNKQNQVLMNVVHNWEI